jgi:hypothetical protein
MKMSRNLLACFLLAMSAVCFAPPSSAAADRPPNIVYILADDKY